MRLMDVIFVNFKGKIYFKLIYEQATVNCDFKPNRIDEFIQKT